MVFIPNVLLLHFRHSISVPKCSGIHGVTVQLYMVDNVLHTVFTVSHFQLYIFTVCCTTSKGVIFRFARKLADLA